MDHQKKCEELRKKTCDSPKHWGPKCNCMKPNEERKPRSAPKEPKEPRRPKSPAPKGPFLLRNIKNASRRPLKRKMLVKVEGNENVDWSDSDSDSESESDSDESNVSNLIDDEATEDEDESWRMELKKYIEQAKQGMLKKENLAGGTLPRRGRGRREENYYETNDVKSYVVQRVDGQYRVFRTRTGLTWEIKL